MIYTKSGDQGTTSLVGGTRVDKCHPRVEAYGTVDELNAHIGLLAEMIQPSDSCQYDILKQVQERLFIVQTLLATEREVAFPLPQLPADAVVELEHHIDAIQATLPPLHNFVIPGGSMAAAQSHVARTVCRRAERCIVQLARYLDENAIPDTLQQILCYVNRLSDYLFVLSRHIVQTQGNKESCPSLK